MPPAARADAAAALVGGAAVVPGAVVPAAVVPGAAYAEMPVGSRNTSEPAGGASCAALAVGRARPSACAVAMRVAAATTTAALCQRPGPRRRDGIGGTG